MIAADKPRESLVQAREVTKVYRTGKVEVCALRGVTLDVTEGEFMAIVGPSGSGKTTLLNLVGALDAATTGTLRVLGRDISAMSKRQRADLRLRRAAMGTSGAGEQHFEVGGRRFGHVIDPRTGTPAEGVLSASAVAATAATADALATAFLVGGTPLAKSYCAEHPGTAAILVLEDDPRAIVVYGSRAGVAIDPARGIRVATDDG